MEKELFRMTGMYAGLEIKSAPGKTPTYKYKFVVPGSQYPVVTNSKVEILEPKLDANKTYEVIYRESEFQGEKGPVKMKWLYAIRPEGGEAVIIETPRPGDAIPAAQSARSSTYSAPVSAPQELQGASAHPEVVGMLETVIADLAQIKDHLGISGTPFDTPVSVAGVQGSMGLAEPTKEELNAAMGGGQYDEPSA